MKTVRELADLYNVTTVTIRNWLKDGLPYDYEKIIGIRTRMVINEKDVEKYHNAKVESKREKKI